MKQNDCDNFPDTVIVGSRALYPLAKGAIQMIIIIIIIILLQLQVGEILKLDTNFEGQNMRKEV